MNECARQMLNKMLFRGTEDTTHLGWHLLTALQQRWQCKHLQGMGRGSTWQLGRCRCIARKLCRDLTRQRRSLEWRKLQHSFEFHLWTPTQCR